MPFLSHLEARTVVEGALRPLHVTVGGYIMFGAENWSNWLTGSPSSSVANSNGFFLATPWLCRKNVTISGLAIAVTTAAAAASGSLVRMALYDDTGTYGGPGTKLVDAGSASIESTGIKDLAFASNYQLQRGKTYWACAVFLCAGATNPQFGCAGQSGRGSWCEGLPLNDNNWSEGSNYLYAQSQSTASMPSTAPVLGRNGLGGFVRPLLGGKIVSMP